MDPQEIRNRDNKTCIFCGSPNVNGEHIISRWCHPFMPPRANGRVESTVVIEGLDGPTARWSGKMPGQMRDWRVFSVCGGPRSSCNNGWMKDIEDRAKPAMVPLIKGEELRLTAGQMRAIATWAVLKNMVANHRAMSPDHLRTMFEEHAPPPEGWGVWIGHFERRAWKTEWLTRLFTVLPNDVHAKLAVPEVDFSNSTSTTLIIGKLLVQVAHCPDVHFGQRWNFGRLDGSALGGDLVRIWPDVREVGVRWPLKALDDEDANAIANGVVSGVIRVAKELRAQRTQVAA